MSKKALTTIFSLVALLAVLASGCSGQTAAPGPSGSVSGDSYEQLVGPRLTQQVGDVDYAYHRFGSGDQTIVMIMGYTGTMTMWTTELLAPLAKNFDVIIFDNQGIGASVDASTEPLTIPQMASNTVKLFEALGVQNPNLFGWSMGGIIALTITAEYGDKINKVVSVAGNTGSPLAKPPAPAVVAKPHPGNGGADV